MIMEDASSRIYIGVPICAYYTATACGSGSNDAPFKLTTPFYGNDYASVSGMSENGESLSELVILLVIILQAK